MASKDYLKLVDKANKGKLKLARKQQQEINNIYKELYSETSKKIAKLNPNTLGNRYLEEVKKAYEEEIRNANKKVKRSIKNNVQASTGLANSVQLDFFNKVDEIYNLGMKSTFKGMFANIPKEAMSEILNGKMYKGRAGLSERIWNDTKLFDRDIDYIISKGIADKKSAYDVAKDLEKYVKGEAKKDYEWRKVYPNSRKVVDYNAQRLARTSIAHAFTMAQKRSCEKNPFIEKIKWLSSNSHRTCEECRERNDKKFDVADLPYDHANGMCTTVPVMEQSLEEVGKELRGWLDGEDNPKLDDWYNGKTKETKSKASTSTTKKKSIDKEVKPKIEKPKIEKPKKQQNKTEKVATNYTKKQLEGMTNSQLKSVARELTLEYYKSGKSGISFGSKSYDKVVDDLLAQKRSKASLIKDIMAMKKKLK